MRFIFGSPPVEQPASEGEGWREVPALGAKTVQTYGLVVSCLGMLLAAVFLRGAIHPSSLLTGILLLVCILPLHELVHALTTPGWGLSGRTVIGFQGGKGFLLPYMYFDGSQSLLRMLLTGLAPVLLLTGLPLTVRWLVPLGAAVQADLGFLAFFNAAISGGDLLIFGWMITRLPLRATVKGNGWRLLWKESE